MLRSTYARALISQVDIGNSRLLTKWGVSLHSRFADESAQPPSSDLAPSTDAAPPTVPYPSAATSEMRGPERAPLCAQAPLSSAAIPFFAPVPKSQQQQQRQHLSSASPPAPVRTLSLDAIPWSLEREPANNNSSSRSSSSTGHVHPFQSTAETADTAPLHDQEAPRSCVAPTSKGPSTATGAVSRNVTAGGGKLAGGLQDAVKRSAALLRSCQTAIPVQQQQQQQLAHGYTHAAAATAAHPPPLQQHLHTAPAQPVPHPPPATTAALPPAPTALPVSNPQSKVPSHPPPHAGHSRAASMGGFSHLPDPGLAASSTFPPPLPATTPMMMRSLPPAATMPTPVHPAHLARSAPPPPPHVPVPHPNLNPYSQLSAAQQQYAAAVAALEAAQTQVRRESEQRFEQSKLVVRLVICQAPLSPQGRNNGPLSSYYVSLFLKFLGFML